jgi:hypothetical protein
MSKWIFVPIIGVALLFWFNVTIFGIPAGIILLPGVFFIRRP